MVIILSAVVNITVNHEYHYVLSIGNELLSVYQTSQYTKHPLVVPRWSGSTMNMGCPYFRESQYLEFNSH